MRPTSWSWTEAGRAAAFQCAAVAADRSRAGLLLLAVIGTVFLLHESLAPELRRPLRRGAAAAVATDRRASPLAALGARPVLAGLIAATLMVSIGGGAMQSVFQFWGRDLFQLTLRDVGLQFMVFALLSAVGQAALIGPLARRFGEKPVAIASIVGVTLGLLLFAAASHVAMVWFGILIFGLANGLFLPAVTSLVSFEADANNRGAVMGLFNAASSAGRIIGPAVSGPIYFNVGAVAPFVVSAVLTALGALLLLRARARATTAAAAPDAASPPGGAIG
ncbi:MAG: MFS transporter [Gammaproteobacteria bacterium]|nr:MFS transporter [Gammaproteobacteria bacterium]